MNKNYNTDLAVIELAHKVMLSLNNEEAYMAWIYTVPDCPTEDDFEYIAKDKELMNDACSAFDRIYKRYRKDGLYTDNQAIIDFCHMYDKKAGYEPIEVIK